MQPILTVLYPLVLTATVWVCSCDGYIQSPTTCRSSKHLLLLPVPLHAPPHVGRCTSSTSSSIRAPMTSGGCYDSCTGSSLFASSSDDPFGIVIDVVDVVATTSTAIQESKRRNRFQNLRERVKKVGIRHLQWMIRIRQWQRSNGRRFTLAVALAIGILFASRESILSYRNDHHQPATQQLTTIERVAQRIPSERDNNRIALLSGVARGGSDSASRLPRIVKQNDLLLSVEDGVTQGSRTLMEATQDLRKYMEGPKSDSLLLLLATSLITPLCKRLGVSPILGFLASGMLLGPNGFRLITGIHTTETLAELGIVFFLFEMGIELSFERLLSMKKDVFGLGLSQFLSTAMAVAMIGKCMGLPGNALVVLGGGLALSSSAFVLQLLKDKDQLATRFGKASFGILLFQDLAVVPLLVVTPILAGSGAGLASALTSAVVKASMALGSIAFAGRVILNPLFKLVAQAQSQEAFLGVVLLTVLSMSFMTEGLGLSNTLGAFLAGVLLSETKYRYQVEADIAPFRGILLGLFFVTVGFEIDVGLIAAQLPMVSGIVAGILVLKTAITTALSMMFGLSLSTSIQTGMIVSQAGEFAFVAFGLARSLGILDPAPTKLMLTCVSLTMALTPLMASLGGRWAKVIEERSNKSNYLSQDRDANEIKELESDDFVIVVGYGIVGKVICDLLDRKLIKYVGVEVNPKKANQARNKGLPVFYGDIGRQEIAESFGVGKAKAVIVCIADKSQANRALIALRRWYPQLKIFARAANADHATRLQNTLNVAAMVPILPEDNLLLTLPFGGAVMKSLGVPADEVNAILETRRKEVLSGPRGLNALEEEAALLQLGIESKPKNITEIAAVNSELDSNSNGSESKARTEAALERIDATKEKSPFVAQVIVDVCPSSTCEEEDEVPKNDSPLDTVIDGMITVDGGTATVS